MFSAIKIILAVFFITVAFVVFKPIRLKSVLGRSNL
jgi:hypothetical protein